MGEVISLEWGQNRVLRFFQSHIVRGTLVVQTADGRRYELGDGGEPRAGMTLPGLLPMLRVVARPDPAFGEAFMHERFEVIEGEIEDLIRVMRLNFAEDIAAGAAGRLFDLISRLQFALTQRASISACVRRVRHHYDIGNDLYERMLDPSMQYSCAFWDDGATTLEAAQLAKSRITLQRLAVTSADMRVVDIGCGWGGLSRYIHEQTGACVEGITLSTQQHALACAKRDELPEAQQAKLAYHLADYRDFADAHRGAFERVVSVGMFEHVGRPQFRTYFDKVSSLLKPGGRAVIHTIIKARPSHTSPWVSKYIFPGGYIPAISEVVAASETTPLRLEALHVHRGRNYARTLAGWRDRFRARCNELDPLKYDATFRRMWLFYLSSCINGFDDRDGGRGMEVGQFVFAKPA